MTFQTLKDINYIEEHLQIDQGMQAQRESFNEGNCGRGEF